MPQHTCWFAANNRQNSPTLDHYFRSNPSRSSTVAMAAAAPSTVATICPNKLLFRLFLAWTDAQVYDEPKLPPSHNAAVVQNRGGPPPTDTHIPRFLRDSTPGILSLDFGGVGANSIATLCHHAIGADGLSSVAQIMLEFVLEGW